MQCDRTNLNRQPPATEETEDAFAICSAIDLVIPTHTTVALVGRSGSGKSTLAKLIPRFYDPDKGYVSIDGKDIRKYRLKSLRHQIGFAMQGSNMFQGTILENLTFGRAIPLSDVEDAARVAYIHDFVASLPEGYQTEIGEQGTDNIHPDHPPHRSIGPCQRSRSRKLGSAQTPICRVAM